MLRILKETSSNFIALETLNNYLEERGIKLHMTMHNGIIYEINSKFYKYYQEGEYPETLPPLIEGRYVECDSLGHTDYYQN